MIPLSNFTLQPQDEVTFTVRTDREIARVESVRHGDLVFESEEKGIVRFSLPLEASDYVKLHLR